MSFALILAIPAVAWAAGDQFQDVLVAGDQTQTINAGGSFTNTYYVDAGGQDGCDVSASAPGVFSINVPSGVSKNPTTDLTFTGCGTGNSQDVTFSSNTPSGASGYSITASRVSGPVSSAGQAGFTLIVNAVTPSNAAPVLTLPGNQTVEATSAAGAVFNFASLVSASDDEDGDLTSAVECLPASGSTFALGTTTVNCSVEDSKGSSDSGNFTVTVSDTTAPSLTVPSSAVVAEATGPTGATVNFANDVSAQDAVDANPTIDCTPASGSTFALGTTQVSCTATDDANNTSAAKTFDVKVVDTTAPALSNVPADITKEATGPNGAAASWAAPSASDLVDGNVAVNCASSSGLKSGDTFPLGTTQVTCTATDAAGNSANSSFNVKVQDTTAPVIASKADVSATASSVNGALVNYTSPATTDAVDGNGTANCTPASGSQFAVGSTTVTCTATDAAGNSAQSTFKVNVAYGWSNFLQPINIPSMTVQQSVFKLGSTVPVKFYLTGASSDITNGTFYLKYAYTGTGDSNGEVEAVATTTGTTGTMFRQPDVAGGQYIYNWSTKGVVTKPGNYELRVYSDADGKVLLGTVSIELKK
jgi:hypothetical protein